MDRVFSQEESGLYAVDAVDLFAKSALASGTRPEEYIVKLFGGGNMFGPAVHSCDIECSKAGLDKCRNVGCRNVVAGRRLFGRRGFRVAVEDVGGEGSREVKFEIWSGDVWVRRTTEMPVAVAATGGRTRR
jgi:chemotaxis protein CheD